MVRRLVSTALVLMAGLAATLGMVPRPATGAPEHTVDYVILAGAAGLRWDDVNPTDTPNLSRLAREGAIGALSVRSAHRPTCPGDGWASLGAGNFVERTVTPMEKATCPPLDLRIDNPDPVGAYLPDQQNLVRHNQGLPWGAQPGALAESMRCTVAVGPGAAAGAARPYGRVDSYAASLPPDPVPLFASCVLSFVDLGTIAGEGAARKAAVSQADATLARVIAARPRRSLLMVAGLSDTDATSRLHVAVAEGPGYEGGWLTSSSTGRSGYLQLVDLAPTALAALGRAAPPKLFAGAPVVRTEGRPDDVGAAINRLSDADHEAGAQRRVAGRFFGVLTVCQLIVMALAVPLLRWARRPAGPVRPVAVPPWAEPTLEVLLVAAALAVPAALVADLVPWWRADLSGLVFGLVTVTALAVMTGIVVLRGRARHAALGPLGSVAGVAAAVVALDVLTGARLQLNGVAGYSALAGGRYAGLGTVGLGVFAAGALLAAGSLAFQTRRQWRPVVVALVGSVCVLMVGSPYLGADAGGAVALTAGVCVATAMSSGGWVTFSRLAWAVLAGLAVITGYALLDAGRPAGQRGSLGVFLADLNDGTGGLVLQRTSTANGVNLLTSPLTLLVAGSAVMIFFVLLRPWGGMKRLFGLFPPVRGALVGVGVATLVAGVVEGVGFDVAGAAAATALPLATLASLRILRHADARTQATGYDEWIPVVRIRTALDQPTTP
jgi:hypothetical protein